MTALYRDLFFQDIVTMAGINWKRGPFSPDSRLWIREPRKRQLLPPSQTRSHCITPLSLISQSQVKDCPLHRLFSHDSPIVNSRLNIDDSKNIRNQSRDGIIATIQVNSGYQSHHQMLHNHHYIILRYNIVNLYGKFDMIT